MKILTKKAITTVLISGKVDFKTKALLGIEELLNVKRLSSSRRYSSFKHCTCNEMALTMYQAHTGSKGRNW